MKRRARRQPPPDLTSLFDVLFIVIFAALIRAAAAQSAAATPAPPPVTPPVKLDPASLHARALADLDAQLAARPAVIVRVSEAGTITALEEAGKVTPLDVPLLEHSADPDVAIAYLGDRSAELRICKIVALHLGTADLAKYLVIIAPAQRLIDLKHALFDGLRRDVDRCNTEQRGLAAIVDPIATVPVPR
jgi:hypothetical protein